MAGLEIPQGDINEWLNALKPYQRSTLEAFLKDASPEAAAERWLSATGSANIVPFGGATGTKPFWERFRLEFRRFVCDDSAYVTEKEGLSAEGPVSKALIVSAASAAIGATIGFSATLLAPAVTLMLCAVGKMGRNAYCADGLPTEPMRC